MLCESSHSIKRPLFPTSYVLLQSHGSLLSHGTLGSHSHSFIMKPSLLSLLVGTAVAGPLGSYRVFEQLSGAPEPWALKAGGQADGDQSFKLRIHLKTKSMPTQSATSLHNSQPVGPQSSPPPATTVSEVNAI